MLFVPDLRGAGRQRLHADVVGAGKWGNICSVAKAFSKLRAVPDCSFHLFALYAPNLRGTGLRAGSACRGSRAGAVQDAPKACPKRRMMRRSKASTKAPLRGLGQRPNGVKGAEPLQPPS